MDAKSHERADNLLVDFHTNKREIVFTVIEIKCRQNLSDDELLALQVKNASSNRQHYFSSQKTF